MSAPRVLAWSGLISGPQGTANNRVRVWDDRSMDCSCVAWNRNKGRVPCSHIITAMRNPVVRQVLSGLTASSNESPPAQPKANPATQLLDTFPNSSEFDSLLGTWSSTGTDGNTVMLQAATTGAVRCSCTPSGVYDALATDAPECPHILKLIETNPRVKQVRSAMQAKARTAAASKSAARDSALARSLAKAEEDERKAQAAAAAAAVEKQRAFEMNVRRLDAYQAFSWLCIAMPEQRAFEILSILSAELGKPLKRKPTDAELSRAIQDAGGASAFLGQSDQWVTKKAKALAESVAASKKLAPTIQADTSSSVSIPPHPFNGVALQRGEMVRHSTRRRSTLADRIAGLERKDEQP